MEAAAVKDPPHLDDTELPPLGPVVERQLLQQQYAVRQTTQLVVGVLPGAVVEQQDGGAMVGEEMLEAEDLATVAQRIPRQQPELRK